MRNLVIKLSLFLIFTTFTSASIASIPTVEGLFRNSNNPDYTGDIIVLKLMISKEKSVLDDALIESEEPKEEPVAMAEEEKTYLKYILHLGEKKDSLIEAEYTDAKMRVKQLKYSHYAPDYLTFIDEREDLLKSWYYSLIHMFLSNKSMTISRTLKKHNTDYLNNKEILNEEKLRLLEDYKNYLNTIREDKGLEESLVSPLKPEEEEEKERITTVLGEKLYKKDNKVALVKKDDSFFWEVTLENTKAYFRNVTKRLDKLEVNDNGNMITIDFGKYILFDGEHELPRNIFLTDGKGQRFNIRVLTLSSFVNKGKSIEERAQEYMKNYKNLSSKIEKMKKEEVVGDNQPDDSEKKQETYSFLHRVVE